VSNVGKDNFNFVFKQYKEVVPRDVGLDPILKFAYNIDEQNIFYAMALRRSG
jgi:hypothetical protein